MKQTAKSYQEIYLPHRKVAEERDKTKQDNNHSNRVPKHEKD